jgi:hypothetical protein
MDDARLQTAEKRIVLNVVRRHAMTPSRVADCRVAALVAWCAFGHRQTATVMRTQEFDEFARRGDALLLDALLDCGYEGPPDAEALCALMPDLQMTSMVQ